MFSLPMAMGSILRASFHGVMFKTVQFRLSIKHMATLVVLGGAVSHRSFTCRSPAHRRRANGIVRGVCELKERDLRIRGKRPACCGVA